MQTQTFVFFGLAGSGKGTQIELLMNFMKSKDSKECVYAGTGEGFRQFIESGNYAAKTAKEYVLSGALVPDFLTNSIFTNMLVNTLNGTKNLITDGYPRTVAQSKVFEQMMIFFKRENIKIIYIKLSEAEAIRRNLSRGRADDTEEGMQKRIEEFNKNVLPSIEYFKEKNGYQILTINGEQKVEDVHKDIIKSLGL